MGSGHGRLKLQGLPIVVVCCVHPVNSDVPKQVVAVRWEDSCLSSSISAWYLFHGFGHDEQLQALSLLAKMKGDPWTTFSAWFLGVCSMLLVDICITTSYPYSMCLSSTSIVSGLFFNKFF